MTQQSSVPVQTGAAQRQTPTGKNRTALVVGTVACAALVAGVLLVLLPRGDSSTSTDTTVVDTTVMPPPTSTFTTTTVNGGIRVTNTVAEPATCTDYQERSIAPYVYCDSGPDVLAIQLALKQEGYDVDPDGYFGQNTKKAVSRFQQAYGADVTGQVDADTWAYLIGTRFENSGGCLDLRYLYNEANTPLSDAELMSALDRAMDRLRTEGWGTTADLMAVQIARGRYDYAKLGISTYLESNNCP